MDFIPEHISKYAEQHTRHEGFVLEELEKDTYLKVLMPRMCSGHLQGQILRMFTAMIRPKRVLEIGTYTGYSAIAMAEVLPSGAELHTIDINAELKPMVETYINKAGMERTIKLHIGNAMNIIPTLEGSWDMVFIDADKENYLNYYHMVLPALKPGGFIIADNVLWSGKVCDETVNDPETRALREFNTFVHNDQRVENVLLPVRDGLMIMRKISE
ncbi:O-methyltransferase [Schleiferia thermophila]|uniref:Putative O-methyltransferase YrrM n=1 Tax=Schleiferia thermophila TaxID=884107 RepID=A0A369A3E9_9FLAO|nr:O-methyltransferase [Schleiferia thermophila]RCX03749.1 putative O-methyltransferase YrrM [Schleiferia thermophila]GCD79983.1 O-methyltransferase [Schleiferia thermophila]